MCGRHKIEHESMAIILIPTSLVLVRYTNVAVYMYHWRLFVSATNVHELSIFRWKSCNIEQNIGSLWVLCTDD